MAHALSAMTVQSTAARRLAERSHPASAEFAFATVEATGREALTELRRLLGVLRREDEELGLAPQPSLAHVGDAVRRSRAGGLPVELLVEGEPRPLPAGVDLTAYRLVQEALVRARDAEAGRAGGDPRLRPLGPEHRDHRRRRADRATPARPARARRGLRRPAAGRHDRRRRMARRRAAADRPGRARRLRRGDDRVRRLRRIDQRYVDWLLALALGHREA